MRQQKTPHQQMAAGFWVTCGVLVALSIAFALYQTSSGNATPHTVYYPSVSKANAEAKREFKAWSGIGFLHYHFDKRCTVLEKIGPDFVSKGVAFGKPKRQQFDGMDMEPCEICVGRK